ncbi:MAG TPA: serine/threonine protein phosphatase [Firmicutes bacterium]|jgi:predicted phosphohydrolase|nr:serine/threonine protein phosphatase [Bacillota bacterium]
MALFAISDLHLSLGGEKPMDIFGGEWVDHHLKIKENWEKLVSDDDTVILGGDLCWAMKLEEAQQDFNFIHGLPGRKVLFKGNHDYWWQSYSKVIKALPGSMFAVQNNYLAYDDDIALCGTRGWIVPGEYCLEQDEKIFRREKMRLEMSLAKAQDDGFKKFIVTLHYPPFIRYEEEEGFAVIMKRYNVKICLYGHLHGADHRRAFIGERDGINYFFISSDYLNFKPLRLDLNNI